VNSILGDKEKGKRADLEELQAALNDTHAFLDRIKPGSTEGAEWERLLNMFHTLDHLQRLHERCEEDEDRAVTARTTPELAEECSLLISCVRSIVTDIEDNNWLQAAEKANDAASKIHLKVRPYRSSVMAGIARGTYDVYLGTGKLEAVRWLRRVSRHVARITEHVQLAVLASGK
jgi:phosphate:Na+ symporter